MKVYKITGPGGVYYARYQQPDGKWTKCSLRTKKETEANVCFGEVVEELRRKGWDTEKVDRVRLEDAIWHYLKHISSRRSASWVQKQDQYSKSTILPFFGADSPVSSISPRRIEAYLNRRSDQVRGVTANKELSMLRSFFKWCKAAGYITASPAAGVEFLDDDVEIVRRFLSLEENEVLLRVAEEVVENDPYYHIGNHFRDLAEMIEFDCHTGLRLGEFLHVEFSDVVNGVLLVRPKPKFKHRIKNHQERQVPLDRQARHALEKMRARRSPNLDLVFWRHGGKRDVQASFTRLIEAASEELTSLKDVTIHTLRKTYASWLVQSGASLQQVKELLGHSTVQITERHYAYLSPRNLQDAVSKLENFVTKSVTTVSKVGDATGRVNSNGENGMPKGGVEPPWYQVPRDFESKLCDSCPFRNSSNNLKTEEDTSG